VTGPRRETVAGPDAAVYPLMEKRAGIRYLAADNNTFVAGSRRETVLTTIAATATHGRAATGSVAVAPIKTRRAAGHVQGPTHSVGIRAQEVKHATAAATTTMIITRRYGVTAVTTRTANLPHVDDIRRRRQNDKTTATATRGATVTGGICSMATVCRNQTRIGEEVLSDNDQRAAASTAMIVRRTIAALSISSRKGPRFQNRPQHRFREGSGACQQATSAWHIHGQASHSGEGVDIAGPNKLGHANVDSHGPIVEKVTAAPNDRAARHGEGDTCVNIAIGELKIAVCRRVYRPIRIAGHH